MREWRHFEPIDEGLACVIDDNRLVNCRYNLGTVTTGKQRVFQCWYVEIELPDGTREIGEDRQSLLFALKALGLRVSLRGCRLFAAGLDRRFYQTGLSFESPLGYVEGTDLPIHMLDAPPYPRRAPNGDSFVEGLIREAVAGMCKRPPFVKSTPEARG